MNPHDTIVAIASAAGGAARGVVRISGPDSVDIARLLVLTDLPRDLCRSTVVTTNIRLTPCRTLPAKAFIWPGTCSYTREPTVEIHTLGSPPLLNVLLRLACQRGARLANPGEFTLRAFLAGRIDLTQAEAVLGVIDATSDKHLQTALRQLAGGLSAPLADLREQLLVLLADLEAGLDFADEDIEFITSDLLSQRLCAVRDQMNRLAHQLATRSMAGVLPNIVLVGATNVGKSSLFNALVSKFGVDAHATSAIESPEPGATRDYLTAEVEFGAARCQLIDTAGSRHIPREDSPGHVAQTMTSLVSGEATLVLDCRDAAGIALDDSDGEARNIVVLTKCDTRGASDVSVSRTSVATSAVTGEGLGRLAGLIADRLSGGHDDTMVASTAERSRDSLRTALEAVGRGQMLVAAGESEELTAAELRVALDELGQIAGVIYTDDVLDRVFNRFCIGK